MPVDDVAHRFRELGRLKFGEDLGDRPAQLATWRLTSPHLDLIEAAAQLYGGTPSATDKGHQVTTETASLAVLVPAQDLTAGQWYEHWTAGGLQRRCTGSALVAFDDSEPEGFRRVGPCICEDENTARICKITTVLRVLLPDLPDLGAWRLTTRSAYAAAELPPAAAALVGFAGPAGLAAATLDLEARQAKKPGQPAKTYMVPALRTPSTLTQLSQAGPLGLGAGAAPAVDEPPALRPGLAHTSDRGPAPTPLTASQAAQDGPEPDRRAPEGPETAPGRSARFEPVARFLAETDAATLPGSSAGILDVLAALELTMTTAGLWDEGGLDAAAALHLPDADWRTPGAVLTPQLRTFAVRALIGANAALEAHPDGYQAARNYERTKAHALDHALE